MATKADHARRFGEPQFNRRLSDKVLAAYNHAYAIDDRETAEQLHSVLVSLERRSGRGTEDRRDHDPLGRADRWAQFIEARNTYNDICAGEGADPDALEEALEAMKNAYQAWSHP